MQMQMRELGAGGYRISEVGLGCWQFGGGFGPMTEETAAAILSAAVESGTNFLDTADVYGDGRSERLIGQFLKTCPHPVTVATKFGRGANVFPDAYTPEALRAAVIASRERLGVEVIDLLQLHCIPTAVLRQGEIFDWLHDLKAEGLIRHFGASVESVEEGLICLAQEGLLSLQVIFNIFRQKLITELFPQAQARGVGIIVRLPLASGLLGGKFSRDTVFAETDHRHYNRDGQYFNVGETFAGLPFEKGVELADALKPHIPPGISMAQMALRWLLDFEAVSVIIPGASSPEQAAAHAAGSHLDPLPEALHQKFADLYDLQVRDQIRGPY
jgi:aryl-alcohol dehydrogenase-like predicted oxidoreductase